VVWTAIKNIEVTDAPCSPADKLDRIPNTDGDVTGARKELAFLGHIASILVTAGFGLFSETGVVSFPRLYIREVRGSSEHFLIWPGTCPLVRGHEETLYPAK